MEYESEENLIYALRLLHARLYAIAQSDFLSLSPKQLLWKQDAESWNIAQCLEHINKLFERELPLLKQAVQKAKQAAKKESYSSSWLACVLLKRLQLPVGGHIPQSKTAAKILLPRVEIPEEELGAICASYQNFALQLRQVLKEAEAISLRENRSPLPQFSWLSVPLGDAFALLLYHLERHIVQAQRLRVQRLFPQS